MVRDDVVCLHRRLVRERRKRDHLCRLVHGFFESISLGKVEYRIGAVHEQGLDRPEFNEADFLELAGG
jgi:hypothetical protein